MSLLTERGSLGIRFIAQSTFEDDKFEGERNTVRCFKWSHDGRLLVYCNNVETIVVKFPNWDVITRLPLDRVQFFKWSPKCDQLVTFHQYITTKDNPNPGPNVIFWSIPEGTQMGSFMHKSSVDGWEPHWTADSNFIIRKIGQQLLVYSRAEPTKVAYMQKVENMTQFAAAPGKPPYKLAVFGPPKQLPAFVRIFKLPDLKDTLANKSFYKADNATFNWSSSGNFLLALANTEVSQDSYYGENTLYLLNAMNGGSQTVDLKKKGPIYCVEWAPSEDIFCAVYGFMPAKATLYNHKGDVVFDYGTGPRNSCYFNQHSTMLMLAGFGNLRGDMECWKIEDNTKISTNTISDTTYFEWAPDGIHYVCATTAPRLRVSNGWKIAHYHGNTLEEYKYPANDKHELWEVSWQPNPKCKAAIVTKPSVADMKIQELQSKPKGYIPPHARGRSDYKAKIRDDAEAPSNPNQKIEDVIDQKNNVKKPISAAALKNKKKRAAAAAKKAADPAPKPVAAQPKPVGCGGEPEDKAQKEFKKLSKKLEAIEKLKEKQNSGEQLEKNQIEKLNTENDIREQIAQLNL